MHENFAKVNGLLILWKGFRLKESRTVESCSEKRVWCDIKAKFSKCKGDGGLSSEDLDEEGLGIF